MKLKKVLIAVAAIACLVVLWRMVYSLAFDTGFRAGYQQEIDAQEVQSESVEL